jgi:simple sugar transport system substrate-binding protein
VCRRQAGPGLRGHDDQALRERPEPAGRAVHHDGGATKHTNTDAVITLDAQVALTALQALPAAHSSAKLYTFDTNAALIAKIKSGQVQWAVDQQPYLQGYESVDALWLYLTNGNVLGGGQVVLTGPSFVDASNVDRIARYAARGTR